MLPIPFDDRLDKDELYRIYGTNITDTSAVMHAESLFGDYVENMDSYINQLIDAAHTRDYETGRIISHNLQTKVAHVGLSRLEKPLIVIENQFIQNESYILILESINTFHILEKDWRNIILDQHKVLQDIIGLH